MNEKFVVSDFSNGFFWICAEDFSVLLVLYYIVGIKKYYLEIFCARVLRIYSQVLKACSNHFPINLLSNVKWPTRKAVTAIEHFLTQLLLKLYILKVSCILESVFQRKERNGKIVKAKPKKHCRQQLKSPDLIRDYLTRLLITESFTQKVTSMSTYKNIINWFPFDNTYTSLAFVKT